MNRLRVGLLANPAAARGSALATGQYVSSMLRAAGVSVVDVSGPDASVARARALDVVDTLSALVVVGGDGTVALGADIVAGTDIALGIVAAGSGNDFARRLKQPVNRPDESISLILECLGRSTQTVDGIVLTHENPDGTVQQNFALGNINLGFDALVNARANRVASGYTATALRSLLTFKPLSYWLEIDGGEREYVSASLLTICNSGVFGGGMVYSPQSRLDDGTLELLTVTKMPRIRLLTLFPRVFRGTHVSAPELSIRSVRSIRVGLVDTAPTMVYSDGEARFPLPMSATVCPAAVRILAPNA